ncbi:23495_t:CDS:2, partial [Gigaspora margarita]
CKSSFSNQFGKYLPLCEAKGSTATCFNSLVQNQLALKLTITELAHDNHTVVPNTISNTINNKLVAGIAIFESDIPKLALFYNWYHEQLESDAYIFSAVGSRIKALLENRWKKIYQPVMFVVHLLDPQHYEKKLPANGMSTILAFIQNITLIKQILFVDLIAWWEGNFKELSPKLYKVATRVLNIPLSSAATKRNWSDFSYIHDKKRNQLESSDITKAVTHFNNRPGDQNNNFELLDPDSDNDESSDDDLIESNNESESVESSESETELETNSNIDSEYEKNE